MTSGAITTRVNKFLQQESDHDWLMVKLNCKGGKDEFKNTVAFSAFPSNLTKDSFEFYVDSMFCDLPADMRKKMKGLYVIDRHSIQDENITFDYGMVNGKISASLLQIIGERNQSGQLEILVGAMSVTRTPEVGWHFKNDYWQSDKARVKRGLQYMFAMEAQKEIC